MRLTILGKHSDDRGKQLEVLTVDLLESLGYRQIVPNVANDAGEVDVVGQLVTPMPDGHRVTKLIAECKAYKTPLDMTDWLKFLGKVFVARAGGEDVVGCLVALSGVNGNVYGSYESLKQKNVAYVRLVESSRLTDYLSKSHNLSEQQAVQRRLLDSARTYPAVELVYYERRVYWIATFEEGQYTVLSASGEYLDQANLDSLKPMIEQSLGLGAFIDLREELRAKRRRLLAKKLLLTKAMLSGGEARVPATAAYARELAQHGYQLDVPDNEMFNDGADQLVRIGIFEKDGDAIRLVPAVETEAATRVAVFREFIDEFAPVMAVGCDWWDRHIDDVLLNGLCAVQGQLHLSDANRQKALSVLKISLSAIGYAVRPDPLIVAHRGQSSVLDEHTAEFDQKQFIRSLFNGLVDDFCRDELKTFYYEKRRIHLVERAMTIAVYDLDDNCVVSDEMTHHLMIGQLDPNLFGDNRFIRMLPVDDVREQRRKHRENKASPGGAQSAPDQAIDQVAMTDTPIPATPEQLTPSESDPPIAEQ